MQVFWMILGLSTLFGIALAWTIHQAADDIVSAIHSAADDIVSAIQEAMEPPRRYPDYPGEEI